MSYQTSGSQTDSHQSNYNKRQALPRERYSDNDAEDFRYNADFKILPQKGDDFEVKNFK